MAEKTIEQVYVIVEGKRLELASSDVIDVKSTRRSTCRIWPKSSSSNPASS